MSHIKAALRPLTAVGLVLPLLGGCKLVTDGAPQWDMTWNVPSKSTSIAVNSLLPSGVTVAANGSAFQVSVAAVSITRTLGTDCSACAAADGQTIPKPAFSSTGAATATLPSGVTTAALAAGDTLTVTIANGFNFDPIKPGVGVNGFLVTTVTSGAATIGKDSVNGATFAIPAAGTVTRKIPLSGNVSGSGGIAVSIAINSPQGDPITINSLQQLTVTGRAGSATAGVVLISNATVTLTNQTVSSAPTALNLEDISESVRDRVQDGKILLAITNPFAVSGNLELRITGGSAPITKTVALATGTTSREIVFTGAELRSILGFNTTLTFSGTVAGSPSVAPGQSVAVASRLQLTLSTEENK